MSFIEIIGGKQKECNKSIETFTKSQLMKYNLPNQVIDRVKLCKCFICMNAFEKKIKLLCKKGITAKGKSVSLRNVGTLFSLEIM